MTILANQKRGRVDNIKVSGNRLGVSKVLTSVAKGLGVELNFSDVRVGLLTEQYTFSASGDPDDVQRFLTVIHELSQP